MKKSVALILFFVTGLILSSCGSKLISITANYDGSAEAGVVLDNANKNIHVIGHAENGDIKEVSSNRWKIKEPSTLKPGETVEVEIFYGEGRTTGKKKCYICGGNGTVTGKCKNCGAIGLVLQGSSTNWVKCPECGGK